MINNKKHCTMILLAGGRGKRMGSSIPKQFIELKGKPILWYSLEAVEHSEIIDECILVVHPDDRDYVCREIISRYNFQKVKRIACAGSERFESVWSGLVTAAGYDWETMSVQEKIFMFQNAGLKDELDTDIIFIHDGARPFINENIISSCYKGAYEHGACVTAVRSKDTVKLVSADGKIVSTPDRSTVWNMQTPQTFEATLIFESYRKVMGLDSVTITDDAQAVELMSEKEVYVVEGEYSNIKVTTPDDLIYAESFLENE